MSKYPFHSRAVWFLAVAVLAVAAAGIAYAAIPDESGVLHACYAKQGQLRLIVPGTQTCRPDETPISWGGTAPTTYTVRDGVSPDGGVAQAFCLPGEKVTGGGGVSVTNDAGLTQNHPISDKSGTIAFGTNAIGWQVGSEGFGRVQAYVVCAS